MEVRRGSKRTEVGVIPEDWNVRRLDELGEAIIGLTYKPSDVRQHGTLVLRSSNIQNDALTFDDNVFVDADISERIKIRRGDVLVCVRNGSRNLIGKSALLDERALGMTFGAFMAVYRSPIGKLVSYLFQSEILKRQINEHLGATINQITNKSLNSFRIPVPPNENERDAIAKALTDVDALLGGLVRLIAKKRDLKQAAVQQLLTGRTRLPGFHGQWEVKRLADVATFHKGKGLPKSALSPYGSEACVHYGELFTQYGETIRETLSRTSKSPGEFRSLANDVLMPTSDVTPSGLAKASCVVADDVVLGGDILVIRTDPMQISGTFLSHVIRREDEQVLCLVTGTTVFHLYAADMKKFTFKLPPFAEQQAIIGVLADMDAEISELRTRRDKTRDLKQAMMQELLIGRTRLVTAGGNHA